MGPNSVTIQTEVADWRVGAKDPAYLIHINILKRRIRDEGVRSAEGIKGLFVLAEPDIADEPGVVPDDPLASQFEERVGDSILGDDVELIDLLVIRVGDDGILGLAVDGVVEFLGADRFNPFDVETGTQSKVSAGLQSGSCPDRVRLRILGRCVLVDEFKAVANVEDRLGI